MVPLLIAPRGGELSAEEGTSIPIQRSLLTARSVEFDALLVGASPAGEVDPLADAKSGGHVGTGTVDPRLTLLVAEMFRHAKGIGAWGPGGAVLDAAAVTGAGVVLAEGPEQVLAQVQELMTGHRVWDRFPTPTRA